jgi:predicted dehydrogenase
MKRRHFLMGSLAQGAAIAASAKPMKSYRVAVIGRTGRGDYGHDVDTVWLDVPGVQIVAVADESEDGRAKAVARLKAPAAYGDYREMLRKEKPDLVSIAPRWLDCHRDMTLACAEASVRGVLIEKPLARTLQEADEMVGACERTGMKMAVCHQTRYSPRLKVVKDLIAGGRIGDVVEVRCRGKEDSRGGGEDLMVLGSHSLDLMRFLMGDPQWCFSRVMQDGKPITRVHVRNGNEGIGPLAGDSITAMYGFSGSVTGHFATHRARQAPGARYSTHLFGTKGVISLGFGTLPPVYLLEDPSWTLFQGGGRWVPVTSAGVGEPEPWKDGSARYGNTLIARDLIRCVEENRQPVSSIHDGRAALEMILAVYESHRIGALAPLPLRDRSHPLERLKS